MKLRGQLVNEEKRMTFPPFEMMAASLRKEGDIWAAYRKDRSLWFPEDLKAQVRFPGSTPAEDADMLNPFVFSESEDAHTFVAIDDRSDLVFTLGQFLGWWNEGMGSII